MTSSSPSVEAAEDDFSVKMSVKHIRVAVIGNVDAGKSTLIGTLKSGILDNGRGQSRLLITKHKHEIDTGRTSTMTTHLIGYDEDGSVIQTLTNPNLAATARVQLKSDADIAAEADNLVSLVDLAGHEKYLKTTIHGISSGMIDYALVLVNANHGPNHMTRHHISLAVAFGIPIIVVLTKTDSCPSHSLKSTKDEIANIVRSSGVQKRPYQIKKMADATIVMEKMHALVPIVSISSVSGDGLDLLHSLLSVLPKRRRHQNKIGRNFEFLIDGVYNITGVGLVVGGFVNAGKAGVGDTVFVGPLNDGSYLKTAIKSAQISRTSVKSVISGNVAGLSLALSKDQRKMIRKGMAVLETPIPATRTFEAEMVVIKGSGVDGTTIKVGYNTMAHILHIKQNVKVEKIELIDDSQTMLDSEDEIVVRPGNRAKITFRFMKRKEFIRPGMRMLFRDGHVRGVGVISATVEEKEDDVVAMMKSMLKE
eukprot:CAMPEP_0203663152 /NCGR_PEP_ID=MMETSP0090-20130426/849_1 /ASSEMBLY_ACC=CAM_ASM_001088 /TAXON_ID=426623 /ORGANISM="Chaetoceros affinis, Strain CCMP159" /LENGTH=478 /DNA_ID=CAMNT_0050526027 /DNA_START=123 /DNA_END=1559 /DNA_ORIENTATION=+